MGCRQIAAKVCAKLVPHHNHMFLNRYGFSASKPLVICHHENIQPFFNVYAIVIEGTHLYLANKMRHPFTTAVDICPYLHCFRISIPSPTKPGRFFVMVRPVPDPKQLV